MNKSLVFLFAITANVSASGHAATHGYVVDRAATVKPEYSMAACHFRIANLFGGHFEVASNGASQQGTYDMPDTGPNASSVLRSGFNINCVRANEHQLGISLGAKQVGGQWFRYVPENLGPSVGNDAYKLAPFDNNAHVKTIVLNGSNWTGRAITIDDTTGDERIRARFFRFCLIHDAQALCGETPIAWLQKPKTNDLWKVRAILESVNFVDPVAPQGSTDNHPTRNADGR